MTDMGLLLQCELSSYKKIEFERQQLESQSSSRLSERLAARWRVLVFKLMVQQQFDELKSQQQVNHLQKQLQDESALYYKKLEKYVSETEHGLRLENQRLQAIVDQKIKENTELSKGFELLSNSLNRDIHTMQCVIEKLQTTFQIKTDMLEKRFDYLTKRLEFTKDLLQAQRHKSARSAQEMTILETEVKTLQQDRKLLLFQLMSDSLIPLEIAKAN